MNKDNKPKNNKSFLVGLPIFLCLVLLMNSFLPKKDNIKTYNEFMAEVEAGTVSEVIYYQTEPTFEYIDINGEKYISDNPKKDDFKEILLVNDISVTEPVNTKKAFGSMLIGLIPYVILLGFLYYTTRNIGGNSQIKPINEAFDKAGKKVSEVKFSDIAANKECKMEMQNLVEFLKNPDKYTKAGATLPKGVIFYGDPGVGKTLLAKAVAGEAGVPFFSVSGSDFVEMYVGLGAKRVRDLFAKAKKFAPCVVFIDEIDSVGKTRGSKESHSELEQTINALLAEMDGFSTTDNILVIAATNRLDALDSALIRPGRFDKQIAIPLPDVDGRKDIIQLYSKNKSFEKDVDFDALARMMTGFSGADIKTLLNEAAIISVNNEHDKISNSDIDRAMTELVMKGHVVEDNKKQTEDEKKLIAYHEAGHTVVAKLLANNTVNKVTIVANTSGAGGVTFITPKKEFLYSKKDILENICVDFAGRAAEKILFGDEDLITTGASSDIKSATSKIKGMVESFGMNEDYGMLNLSVFDNLNQENEISACSKIAKEQYERTEQFLRDHKEQLDAIANALIEKETLYERDIDILLGLEKEEIITVEELTEKEEINNSDSQLKIEQIKKEFYSHFTND